MEMTNVGNLLELRRIYSRGITGKGITTAVLDTGIYAHPDFFIPQNKILYFQDFVRNRRGPFDDNGHGTHVSGIIIKGTRRTVWRWEWNRGCAGKQYCNAKST